MFFGILTNNNKLYLIPEGLTLQLGIRQFFFLLTCHSKRLLSREFYTFESDYLGFH